MMRSGTYLLAFALAATAACATDTESDPGDESIADIDVSTRAVETANYKLVRRGSEKCLDVNANSNSDGAVIQQWGCNGSGAQAFRIEPFASGYRLIKQGTGSCVDVSAAGTADGTKVQLWGCNGTAAQTFRLDDRGGGYYRVINTNSNKCLDVEGGGNNDGAKVRIMSCNSSNQQRWRLDKLGGTNPNPDPTWRRANLTWFTSYPDPGSEECEEFNGCMWAGYFAFVDGKQTEQWVASHNILAVHSRDAGTYALKTLRLRQNGRTIDAVVYDMCSDSDCSGCCTQNANANGVGFLIDIESYTRDRFGSGEGIVEWQCLDCN